MTPPVVVAAHGVLRLTRRDLGQVGGQAVVDERGSTRTGDRRLAQVRDVEDADRGAHRGVLGDHPGAGVGDRHVPAAEGAHRRAERHVLGVQRRVQQRFFGRRRYRRSQLRHEPDGNLRRRTVGAPTTVGVRPSPRGRHLDHRHRPFRQHYLPRHRPPLRRRNTTPPMTRLTLSTASPPPPRPTPWWSPPCKGPTARSPTTLRSRRPSQAAALAGATGKPGSVTTIPGAGLRHAPSGSSSSGSGRPRRASRPTRRTPRCTSGSARRPARHPGPSPATARSSPRCRRST